VGLLLPGVTRAPSVGSLRNHALLPLSRVRKTGADQPLRIDSGRFDRWPAGFSTRSVLLP